MSILSKIPSRFRKKRYMAAFGALVLLILLKVLTGGDQVEQKVEQAVTEVSAISIQPGLKRTFSTTGEVQANQSASITADAKADVEEIFVKPGQTVKQGDPLVSLNSASVAQRYATANASYINAVQNLERTKLNGQSAIDSAETALKTALVNLDKLLKQNAARKVQADEALKAAKLNLDLSISSAETGLQNAVRAVSPTVLNALVATDILLEVSDQYEDGDYVQEIHIGSKNPSLRTEVEIELGQMYTKYYALDGSYNQAIALLRDTEQLLNRMLLILQASVTSSDFTESELEKVTNSITSQLSAIRSNISQLETAQRAVESAQRMSGGTSQTIIDAEAQYQTTIADLEASEQNARLQAEQAEKSLASAYAAAGISEVSARANITAVSGDLQQARISQDKLTINAPFDGVVVDVPVRLGEEVSAGAQVVSIQNDELLKVVAYVTSDEAGRLAAGDMVIIGGDLEASITSVAPSADPVTKKYKIEIAVQTDTLTPGTFVNVTYDLINQESTDTRIFVPITAVQISAAETFVWGIDESGEGPAAKKIPITIGNIEGKYVEVVSGLKTGMSVITEGGRNIDREGAAIEVLTTF